MNSVVLIGNVVRDPEIRYAQNDDKNTCVARYTLAVPRAMSKKNEADFISCIAFGKQGEFAEKYFKKGLKIAVEGHIQTGSFTNKDGKKVYTTDVYVDRHEFVLSKAEAENSTDSDTSNNTDNNSVSATAQSDDSFMNIPDGLDDEIPFL